LCGDCRFDEQAESDAIIGDIEASINGLSREPLRSEILRRERPSGSTAPTSGVGPIAFRARSNIWASGPMHVSCSPLRLVACLSASITPGFG